MTIFIETWWNLLISFLKNLVGSEAPAVAAWAKQFASDEGQIILQDAAIYGPQIVAGTITITAAADQLWTDLKAKGITDVATLGQTVLNALRTQQVSSATPSLTS